MGFDSAKFVTSVAEDKKCLLCSGVLDNPVRASCGHVFCSGCILPWVITHGQCPKRCRSLTPTDLENVLPLREVILNLKVKCEFFEHGCKEVIRLTDLLAHTQICGYQPVACSNSGCSQVLPLKEVNQHEKDTCPCREVGDCDKGCGLMLYLHTVNDHDCYQALKELVKYQENVLLSLEEKLTVMSTKFSKREKVLLQQVTILHKQLGSQTDQFNRAIKDLKSKHNDGGFGDSEVEDNGEFIWRRVILHRDKSGSLGFNIMGGYTPENNNNNGPVGVVISRVTAGGVGDVNGIRVNDRIIKMDLPTQDMLRYSCMDCSKEFAQQAGLSRHRRNAHSKPNVQPALENSPTTSSSDEQTTITTSTPEPPSETQEADLEIVPVSKNTKRMRSVSLLLSESEKKLKVARLSEQPVEGYETVLQSYIDFFNEAARCHSVLLATYKETNAQIQAARVKCLQVTPSI